jgi:hypothetical protein
LFRRKSNFNLVVLQDYGIENEGHE